MRTHRINVDSHGKLWNALCADCGWQVRGVAREVAEEFAVAHAREPNPPHPEIPQATMPAPR